MMGETRRAWRRSWCSLGSFQIQGNKWGVQGFFAATIVIFRNLIPSGGLLVPACVLGCLAAFRGSFMSHG